MIAGGAWSWERSDADVMGSGLNWARFLGTIGYFSPLDGGSVAVTMRSVYRLKLKVGQSIGSFATSPEHYVGNELYNFNRKLQYRLINTMYNAFYLTKSSMPQSFYNKNNFIVSERESPLFEQLPGGVCPFFAELLQLDRIKNNCPVVHFDGNWAGTRAFKNVGPRANSGLEPRENSILSNLFRRKGVIKGKRVNSLIKYYMFKYKLSSFIDPYRLFAYEAPRHRFTPSCRYGIDIGTVKSFRRRETW